jgi:peptidyl-tRNA hydrolase
MKPAMYLFLNKGLGMSTGKSAAQAGHASGEAYLLSNPRTDDNADAALWDAWREGLHYAKYVMEARDTEHLCTIERYLNDRGFRTNLIIDEGHTEIPPLTPTALGVALVDKDDPHTKATFSSFKLYKDPQPPEPGPRRPKPDPSRPRRYSNTNVVVLDDYRPRRRWGFFPLPGA